MRFTMAILCLAAASAVPAAENRQQLQFLQSLLSGGPKPNLSKDQWTQLLSGISKQQWVQILGNFNKAAGRSLDQEAGERQLPTCWGCWAGAGWAASSAPTSPALSPTAARWPVWRVVCWARPAGLRRVT